MIICSFGNRSQNLTYNLIGENRQQVRNQGYFDEFEVYLSDD